MSTEHPLPVLDDVAKMQAVDTRNMLRLINELPEQCETALGLGRSYAAEELEELPNVVLISGVGDAGIAAEMAVLAVSDSVAVPVLIDQGGQLPKCVGEQSLVLVVDYLGKSQASLRVYKEAKLRGARVICITSGGKLHEAAIKDGSKTVRIPPSQPARTAIGYLFIPLVALFERYGLATGLVEKLSYGIMLLKNSREALRFENSASRNVAKQIAMELVGKRVSIYGARDYRSAVARRWKSQINSNAKSPAGVNLFADAALGEICGWELTQEQNQDIALVFLRDPQDRTEIAGMMNAAEEVLERFQIVSTEIKGATVIEKLLYGVYLADYVSYYLAMLNEVNPTLMEFVTRIDALLSAQDSAEQPSQVSQPTA
jgi:glucose/mannose-6-phosphate isomerase